MEQQTPTRGAIYGLLAAALFGMSAPLSKLLLSSLSPLLLAGLLYLGGGLGLSLYQRISASTREARLSRQDKKTLALIIATGGIVAPVLMLWGLTRVSAVAGALLLNVEAPFTMLLALLFFKEHLGRSGLIAALLIFVGGALFALAPEALRADGWGVASIAAACLCWGLDNNLTQKISLKDPFALVQYKTFGAGLCNIALALLFGDALPVWSLLLAALLLGSLSYGVSILLDAYALRILGAAREAAYFATAPFIGALASIPLLGETPGWLDAAAALCMVAGVIFLLRERHSHEHSHEATEHEHIHTHDEHHQHEHEDGSTPDGPHSHRHKHEAITHEHHHVSDSHHRHKHV